MPMPMPEAGQEWFHRESLTPVTVDGVRPESENIQATVRIHADNIWTHTSVNTFLRDYARNQNVTLELLERMGWERCFAALPVLNPASACRLWHEGDLFFEVDDKGLRYRDRHFEGMSLRLATPATLRDLLVTLRVFGLEAKAPEVVG